MNYKTLFYLSGFKETAFAYAISAAGMITQVSRACAMGKLMSCGCTAPTFDKVNRKWLWDGCDNNVHFGERYTKNFLDSKEKNSKDSLSRMHMHNNRVGRMVSGLNHRQIGPLPNRPLSNQPQDKIP